MFSNFTWWQFTATILIALVIYYPVILFLYYRNELSGFINRLNSPAGPAAESEDVVEEPYTITEDNPQEKTGQQVSETAMIADLMEDIKTGIQISIDTKASNKQVLSLLKATLQKYQDLKQSPHRQQLNEFIIAECKRAKLVLAMAQVYALWNGSENSAAT